MNKYFFVLLGVMSFTLLYFLAPILTPFLIGTLLAFLVNPIVNLLMRLHLPRIIAVVIVFLVILLVIILLVVLIVPLIQTQTEHLVDLVPDFLIWIQTRAMPLLKQSLVNADLIHVASLKEQLAANWTKAGGVAGWIVATLFHSGFVLLHRLFDIILIFVVTFYLLYDWEKVIEELRLLLPRKYEPTIVQLTKDCNDVLGAFFRGQLLVMTTLGIFYSIALSLIGLKVGVMIGVIVGLLSIIPYLGIVVGIIAASIAAFMQFGTLGGVAPVLIVFAIGQTLDGMFITPKLVGDRIGLHPVAVIFSVLAGGVLFGFFGVLLALPVASIIMVLLRFLKAHYYSSHLYQ